MIVQLPAGRSARTAVLFMLAAVLLALVASGAAMRWC
jgi:hypothetical protein